MTDKLPPRLAIPYGRFSSTDQSLGDSEKRQAQSFSAICRRWQLVPHPALRFFDKAASAYKGTHLKREMGKLLAMLKNGAIQPDGNGRMPCLCVEAIDRFTRQTGFKATDHLKQVILAGMPLVADEDDLWVDASNIDDKWGEVQDLIASAHKFSKRLSRRQKGSWQRRREHLAETGDPIQHLCPQWLEWTGKGYAMVEVAKDKSAGQPKKIVAETLKAACLLGVQMGHTSVRRKLGLTGREWNGLCLIWRRRSLIGYATIDGKEIADYYPALLSKEEFYALGAALEHRNHTKQGRVAPSGSVSNLFTSLIFWDGVKCVKGTKNGGVMMRETRRGGYVSLPYLEETILSGMLDISPADLQPQTANKTQAELATLEGEIADLEHKRKELTEIYNRDGGAYLLEMISANSRKIGDLIEKREGVRASLSVSKDASLTACKGLIEHLSGLSGEALQDARRALRNTIAGLVRRIDLYRRTPKDCDITLTLKSGLEIEFVNRGKWRVILKEVA